jgi:hypothetical protein
MTADKELASFIGKYSPEVAAVAKAALVKMRKRLPGAVELVWDNYNALAVRNLSTRVRQRWVEFSEPSRRRATSAWVG